MVIFALSFGLGGGPGVVHDPGLLDEKHAEQVDRLFRASALMRSKWDQRHGEQTYERKPSPRL